MSKVDAAKWITLGIAGMAAVVGVALVYKARKLPIKTSYYVALGSSFAAGLGLGPRDPDSPIVSQRSINGYPQQLAKLLRVPSFMDMTSSGSTVGHVLHGGQMMLGPQIDALSHDTRLVTFTAGGNDIGYVGNLIAMGYANKSGFIGTAVRTFWNGPKTLTARDFPTLATNMRATFAEIRRRSPLAEIVVVIYPLILPGTGTCPALGITQDQASLMRSVGETLAQTTRDAAMNVGATIVDMAVISKGHDACSSEPWVNGFKPRNGADFHPTMAGAIATAKAIAAAIA